MKAINTVNHLYQPQCLQTRILFLCSSRGLEALANPWAHGWPPWEPVCTRPAGCSWALFSITPVREFGDQSPTDIRGQQSSLLSLQSFFTPHCLEILTASSVYHSRSLHIGGVSSLQTLCKLLVVTGSGDKLKLCWLCGAGTTKIRVFFAQLSTLPRLRQSWAVTIKWLIRC